MKKVTLLQRLWEENECYPDAELFDYYKLSFQALFGPGHLVTDPQAAGYYLKKELEEAVLIEKNLFRDLSFDEIGLHRFDWEPRDYCRVSLRVITEGIMSFEQYLAAFLKSAEQFSEVVTGQWAELWYSLESYLYDNDLLQRETFAIEDLHKRIAEGSFVVRHSDSYRNKYRPHYRVIKKELINRYLL